ncbi:probable protein phosphatase 2C 37 isoform X2 [Trifolium pratense]|uniref:probable protein phosphatase 2C 37 isoform X2 n=1 Tax=Trifolium pratense TaxID=57577 RepID=UPI001E696196|nr:probable protein phosphatase 2C 37 isoform X2 [Trifolium pratense]
MKEASRNNLHSGSTATIVLVADDKILVANIGDSKAFICSENFQSPKEAKASLLKLYRQTERDGSVSVWNREKYRLASSNGFTHFAVKELTSDHHPDREDEKTRVEAAGGQVLNWGGVPRVNGQLAITRAMAAVVVPLESAKSSANSLRRSYTENEDAGFPSFGLQESAYRSSANDITSDLLHLEHPHLLDTKFKRILVEVKHGDFGCFYLSENLDDSVDSKWPPKKDDREDYLYELPQPLPDALHQQAVDGPVILYNDQNFCFHLSSTINQAKDQCINPEGFASFIGLLESIPLIDAGSDNESSDYSMPDSR